MIKSENIINEKESIFGHSTFSFVKNRLLNRSRKTEKVKLEQKKVQVNPALTKIIFQAENSLPYLT